MRVINKKSNEYADSLDRKVYELTPKAVFAAVAISSLTVGGDYLSEASQRLIAEWWILYRQNIVPQKPPFPEPAEQEPE